MVVSSIKIKRLTGRDIEILNTIYRYRTFTTNQVFRLFFEKIEYCWKRLSYLKQDGYIESVPVVDHRGMKTTSAYYITPLGIKALHENTASFMETSNASDNRIPGRRLRYQIDVNEVYTRLCKLSFLFWDSRETKRHFNLDRNSSVNGYLITPDQRGMGLYVLSKDPEPLTISRIAAELKKTTAMSSYLVLCKTLTAFQEMHEVIQRDSHTYPADVRLLPYEPGLALLELMGTQAQIEQLYAQYLPSVTRVQEEPFAYKSMDGEQTAYVCELLSNSIKTRHQVFAYNPYEYQAHQCRLTVLAWEDEVDSLRFQLTSYRHIRVIGISRTILTQYEQRGGIQ